MTRRPPPPAQDADARLLARSAAGDRAAFDALVERHRRAVINLAWRYLGDRVEAEDMAQEAFVRLYRARRRYRKAASVGPLLRRIVVNLCLNERRRRERKPADSLTGAGEAQEAPASGPEAQVMADELQGRIIRALGRLPGNQRMAVVLSRHEGLSYREVAALLGCSAKAVEGLLHRARLRLMEDLEDWLGDEV